MPSGFFAHYDIPDMTAEVAGTGSEQYLHLGGWFVTITVTGIR